MSPTTTKTHAAQRSGGNARLSALALGASALALVLVLWRSDGAQAPASMPAELAGSAHREQLDHVEAALEELRGELQRLAAQVPASGPGAGREPVADPEVERKLRDFEGRVAQLDAAVQQVQRELAARRVAGVPVPVPGVDPARAREPAPDPAERIATFRGRALDASRTETERLAALRNLRGLGTGARSGDVALAMIALAQTSQDPAVRADVWRQMSGAKDPALVQPLLTAASGDPDQKVREEAAETLGDFLDRPEVRQTLERIARDDASLEVRSEALRSLAGRR